MSLVLLLSAHDSSPDLIAEVGAFTLTGNDAGLIRGRTLTADPASFALTGQAAGSRRRYALDAEPFATGISGGLGLLLALGPTSSSGQSFVLTGIDSAFQHARKVVASVGAFTLTGQDATLAELVVAAEAGAFTLTGVDVELTRKRQRIFARIMSTPIIRASARASRSITARPTWG